MATGKKAATIKKPASSKPMAASRAASDRKSGSSGGGGGPGGPGGGGGGDPGDVYTFNFNDIREMSIQPGLNGWIVPNPPRPPRLDFTLTIRVARRK